MKTAAKFEWKQAPGRVAARYDVSLGYGGSYTIVQLSQSRFQLGYSTPSFCVDHVGVYSSLDKAKRAASRHFKSNFIG